MENKAPKEIFIPSANIEAINSRGQKCGMFYTDKKHDTEVKYLSESYVKQMLADKDKEIEELKETEEGLLNEIYRLKQFLA